MEITMLDNFDPIQNLIDTVNLLTNKIAQLENQIADVVSGSITTGNIANSAITESKLANGAVTENKLADGAVTESKLANGAVTESKLADHSVSVNKLTEDLYAYLTRKATTSQSGLVELSTDAEVIAMVDLERVLTPSNLSAFLNSLGLSGNLTTYRIFNGDLNTLISTGIWFYLVSCTNKPSSGGFTYGIVEIFSEYNDVCVQRVTSVFTGRQTSRRYRLGDGTVWTTWDDVVYLDQLTSESDTRYYADLSLQGNIGIETTARINADNYLQSLINSFRPQFGLGIMDIYTTTTTITILAGETVRLIIIGAGGSGGGAGDPGLNGNAGGHSYVNMDDIGFIARAFGGGAGSAGYGAESGTFYNDDPVRTTSEFNRGVAQHFLILHRNDDTMLPTALDGYGLGGARGPGIFSNYRVQSNGGRAGCIDLFLRNDYAYDRNLQLYVGIGGASVSSSGVGVVGCIAVMR